MYSFKEKNKLYYDLQNADFAEADLNLLCKVRPEERIVETAKRNPQRHHKEVLYRLLDLKTAEEIRLNRRGSKKPEKEAGNDADAEAKKQSALEKMAAGKAAKKAEREAAKASNTPAAPKTVKEPKAKKSESSAAPEATEVPGTEKKK
jgi:hypothetical protein